MTGDAGNRALAVVLLVGTLAWKDVEHYAASGSATPMSDVRSCCAVGMPVSAANVMGTSRTSNWVHATGGLVLFPSTSVGGEHQEPGSRLECVPTVGVFAAVIELHFKPPSAR